MERLLERDQDLAALIEVIDAARGGRGGLALIGGEAGSGKTSLLRVLRAQLVGDVEFFLGACEALSVPAPLAPMRELADAIGVKDAAALRGDSRVALSGALLDELAGRAPALAAIEDAHWADPATLDVLRLLARRVEDAGVVVVVTYRDDELAANASLAVLVGDLVTGPAVTRIALSPLSPSAVRGLAEPAGIDPVELARVTGGNPFLVVESIAAEGKLPASVRDATLARVARLGASARGAVDAAAVIGQRVTPGVLAAVAPGTAAAVEEALDLGVLTDDGIALGFRHELIRQAVESSISTPRRTELDRRVFTALRDQGEDDHVRLAHHAERAGLVEEMSRHALLAAAEAEHVGALREASLQLERTLRAGVLSEDERFEVLLRCARAANFSSQMELALSRAQEALSLAERMNDPGRYGRASVVLAWALWSLDRIIEARAAAERAVQALEPTGDIAELARARAALVRMLATAFGSAAAIEAAPRALELAERSRLEEVRVDVMISLGLAWGRSGDPDGLGLLGDALASARAGRLHIQTIRAYVNTIVVAVDARDHATVDDVSASALALLDQYQTAIPHDVVLVHLARNLLDRGRWDEALTTAARSKSTWHGEAALASVVEGLVMTRRGEPDVSELLDNSLDEIPREPLGWRHAVIRVALAEAAWLSGDRAAARSHALAGLSAPYAGDFSRSSAELAVWAMRCGQPSEPPAHAPEPLRLELAGDWRGAISAWRELDAPYEAALAALPGDESAAREAMAALRRLGAAGAARAFAHARVQQGSGAPRGPRRSTLANPAGLTQREQEVLVLLARGDTNPAIADALHLSRRTVAHHVSAILTKLDAPTRMAAVESARNAGLLAQDGPPSPPT